MNDLVTFNEKWILSHDRAQGVYLKVMYQHGMDFIGNKSARLHHCKSIFISFYFAMLYKRKKVMKGVKNVEVMWV